MQSTHYLFTNSLPMSVTNTADVLFIHILQMSQLSLFVMQPLVLQCKAASNLLAVVNLKIHDQQM